MKTETHKSSSAFQQNNQVFDHNQIITKNMRGKWTDEQSVAYFQFLIEHRRLFQKPGERKRNNIFLKMADQIPTRSVEQCRSHHQKIENYSKTKQIGGICQYLLEKLTYGPHHKKLQQLLERSDLQMKQTMDAHNEVTIKKENYMIIGNKVGCFNVIVNIDSLMKW